MTNLSDHIWRIVYDAHISRDQNLRDPIACLATEAFIRLLIKPADVFILVTLTDSGKGRNYRNVTIGEAILFYNDPKVERLQWFSAIGSPRPFACRKPIPWFCHRETSAILNGTSNVFHSTGFEP